LEGNHQPALLEMDFDKLKLQGKSRLAMDLIALRDIAPGEEVFVDYGDEWEAAWERHVQEWRPVLDAEKHMGRMESMNVPTYPTAFELLEHPRQQPQILCNEMFLGDRWKRFFQAGKIDQFVTPKPGSVQGRTMYRYCDIMSSRHDEELDTMVYTAMMFNEGQRPITEGEETKTQYYVQFHGHLTDVPKQAFMYIDPPFTTDHHLRNAFRHDARIPDDIFPEAWKNTM
jgi:hypothetical protein